MIYVVAEAGSNWTPNNLGSALALIQAAADAGADAVKFQYFRVDEMDHSQEWRERHRPWELPEEWVASLRAEVKRAEMDFILSLFEWHPVLARSCDVLKVASSELGNRRLLQAMNRFQELCVINSHWQRGRVFLSTGETGYAGHRIGLALSWLNRCDVTLMHCVCQYPTRMEEADLYRVEWLAENFGLPVGWSSHVPYPGTIPVALDAIRRGASVVEAHLKLETTPVICPDSGSWSLLPSEFAELTEAVRAIQGGAHES